MDLSHWSGLPSWVSDLGENSPVAGFRYSIVSAEGIEQIQPALSVLPTISAFCPPRGNCEKEPQRVKSSSSLAKSEIRPRRAGEATCTVEEEMAELNELYNEGEKLKDAGDYEGSIAKFCEILEQDEAHGLAHFALAVSYGKVGKHEDAVKHGERAAELEPNDPFSFTALSVTYQRAYAGTQNMEFIPKAEEAMARAHMLQQGQH